MHKCLVAYTQEGDPVSYELRYAGKGKAVVLIRDSTQDKHDSPQVVEYECGQLVQESEALRLIACSGDGKPQDIELPWEHR